MGLLVKDLLSKCGIVTCSVPKCSYYKSHRLVQEVAEEEGDANETRVMPVLEV